MIPGIHVNTAGAILFASSNFLLTKVSPEFLCVLMVSMSIAHALIEFVPSMLLGVPQEGTATSILPGHRMVLQGRSKEVIRIVSVGGFGAIIVTILMLPIFSILLPFLHDVSKPFTWAILLVASIYLTYSLTSNFRDFLWSSLLFVISGILGWVIFQSPISSGVTLMCVFSGLFGISTKNHWNNSVSLCFQLHVDYSSHDVVCICFVFLQSHLIFFNKCVRPHLYFV